MTGAVLGELPDGDYAFTDHLDDDGQGGGPYPICLTLRVRGRRATFDFTGTHGQVRGSVNANRAITTAAVFYCLRCLLHGDQPTNEGVMRPVTLQLPPASLVDAHAPAAVAGGNVETSQRIVDVVLGALARAAPDRIPAASQGTMNNLTVGGIHPVTGAPFAYYETIPGGGGAGPLGTGHLRHPVAHDQHPEHPGGSPRTRVPAGGPVHLVPGRLWRPGTPPGRRRRGAGHPCAGRRYRGHPE